MTDALAADASTRLLVIAPHPDDETLATGGLIQRVLGAGGAARVVLVTDGDNNPWPQRWIERRWRIGETDRARWGARRRAEAAAALAVLADRPVPFAPLGWPDQGVTNLLLRDSTAAAAVLQREINSTAPTLIVVPSTHDRHPDHSALAVLFTLALAASETPAARVLSFVVHASDAIHDDAGCSLDLTGNELARKRLAIGCHTSQLALTRERIYAHARAREDFQEAGAHAAAAAIHPVQLLTTTAGAVTLTVAPINGTGPRGDTRLTLLVSRADGVSVWTCDVPAVGDDGIHAYDARGSAAPWRVGIRQAGRRTLVTLPAAALAGATRVFAKCRHRGWFFDHSGWQTIVVAG